MFPPQLGLSRSLWCLDEQMFLMIGWFVLSGLLFFRAVLESQQNRQEGTETSVKRLSLLCCVSFTPLSIRTLSGGLLLGSLSVQ